MPEDLHWTLNNLERRVLFLKEKEREGSGKRFNKNLRVDNIRDEIVMSGTSRSKDNTRLTWNEPWLIMKIVGSPIGDELEVHECRIKY